MVAAGRPSNPPGDGWNLGPVPNVPTSRGRSTLRGEPVAEKSPRRWWIIGCGGLIVIAVVAAGAIVGIGWFASRNEHPFDRTTAHPVPPAGLAGSGEPMSAPAGRVVLDLASAEFYIEPAPRGKPLNVEASYDRNYYVLTEQMKPGDPWIFELKFEPQGWGLIRGIKELIGSNRPVVRLQLPADAPIELEVELNNGAASVDIGALRLVSADFEVQSGLVEVASSEPPLARPERIKIHGGRGGVMLRSLAVASPRLIDIDFKMGGAQLDLRGQWIADSEIKIDTSLSDMVLRLPRQARIEGLETAPRLDLDTLEQAPPTLRFDITTGTRGKVKILE